MKKTLLSLLIFTLFFSCSHKKQLVYIDDIKAGDLNRVNFTLKNNIEIGDVIQIDVNTVIPEASALYNSFDKSKYNQNSNLMIIDGYKVEKDSTINYPLLGRINVVGFTINELAFKLKQMLIDSGQLTNPFVKVNKVNSKYTVLGEVKNPGTYFNYENQLNIFQALGFAGDLLITAKRKNVKLIRQENGLRKTYKFTLNNSEIFDKPYYYIKSNDVIIIEPSFSKIKSAGFIGSPNSIASLSSLLLSITLLIINK